MFRRILETRLAGISSIRSTVSSRYSSSRTSRSSLSLRALMSRSWSSESSSSVNTSAATSLGSRRNTRTVSSGPSSSRNSAMSTSFILTSSSRRRRELPGLDQLQQLLQVVIFMHDALPLRSVSAVKAGHKNHRAHCACGCYERTADKGTGSLSLLRSDSAGAAGTSLVPAPRPSRS